LIHAVKAPNGIARAEAVPPTHRPSSPCDSAAAIASRASLLLPTPAPPDTTTPAESGVVIEDAMVLICSVRPVSGHVKRTRKA